MSEKSISISFGKDKTAIIKGFAIIFMIILHCGIPEYYTEKMPFSENQLLVECYKVLKLCVGIFTFMVGYGYAFSKTKDLQYSWEHIEKLLIPFWTILFVFTFPIAFFYNNLGSIDSIILNLFGINSCLNWFSWFVAFYIYAMIIMPILSKIIDQKPIWWTLFFIIVAYLMEASLHQFYPLYTNNDFTQRLFDCLSCTPCMLLGYLFANKQWFSKVMIQRKDKWLFIAFLLIIAVFVLRFHISAIMGFNLDFFYAPMFIFAVLILFNIFELPLITKILTIIGNVSVYMWFFHALFFTKAVRNFYQPFILISDSLWIIIPWTLFLTFTCSWLIIILTKKIKTFLHY